MKKIPVRTARPYEVWIGAGLRREIGKVSRAIGGEAPELRAAIVTDTTVAGLYLDDLRRALSEAGIGVEVFTFAPGENSKTLATYEKLIEFLARRRLTRSDLVIALGGGIPGDLAGFAAATFLRGVKFIQVPTTLLAALDSSVGGKTGVNLSCGKNLCGAFYQSSQVVCDTETLRTLPAHQWADGAAEAVKYGMIADAELFELLASGGLHRATETVISRGVEIKAEVVAEDEFDRGRRQLLNFGHTLGHAVEKCSDFAISHGHAVAIGMILVTAAAARRGICPPELPNRLEAALTALELPTECPFSLTELLAAAASDKKRSGAMINLVVPEALGVCRLEKLEVSALGEFFA